MNKDELLIVNECFTSIQGESTRAGRVCFFIRLAGCNLTCNYCDTAYAANGSPMTVDSLLLSAVKSGAKLVEITGGEPLIQKATPLLAAKLIAAGFELLIETNGSMDVSVLPELSCRIVDCKLPGSGMENQNFWPNFNQLTSNDEVKFVISNRADFEYALKVVEQYRLAGKCEIIYSPVWGKVPFKDLAEWIINCRAPGRMQLQLHKLIWGPEATGV